MSNVLSEDKKQQVIALGKLGWTLRRIEQATGVRRETASNYLKAAGIGVIYAPGGCSSRRNDFTEKLQAPEKALPGGMHVRQIVWRLQGRPTGWVRRVWSGTSGVQNR